MILINEKINFVKSLTDNTNTASSTNRTTHHGTSFPAIMLSDQTARQRQPSSYQHSLLYVGLI